MAECGENGQIEVFARLAAKHPARKHESPPTEKEVEELLRAAAQQKPSPEMQNARGKIREGVRKLVSNLNVLAEDIQQAYAPVKASTGGGLSGIRPWHIKTALKADHDGILAEILAHIARRACR